jgi:hypothetical protein
MKKAGNRQAKGDGEDERFREVYSDPRFMTVPKKVKKVEIDDRFKKALTSKEFNLIQKVDKYGHRVDKQDTTMKQFYKVKDATTGEQTKDHNKYYDDEGKFKWDAHSSSEDDDEAHSDDTEEAVHMLQQDEDSNVWSEEEGAEKDAAADQVQPGLRLALTNMDWDNLNATDILALFSSLCKGDMLVKKVEIYPSLFGLEQMKKDTLYGPPKELFAEEEGKKPKKKRHPSAGNELEEREAEDAFNQNQLRKYEIQKMKYFYAVAHCNSP